MLTRMQKTERHCCYRAAMNPEAGYCNDCGDSLLRCIAYEECSGLVTASGHCEVCIAPRLILAADSVRETSVGGTVVLNLDVQNTTSIPRPLFVKAVWAREQQGEWEQISLPWDRIEANSSAPFSIRADQLDRAGIHEVELLIVVASRFEWREEVVAFSGRISLQVEAAQAVSVQQNIYNLSLIHISEPTRPY